jgi:hypothetical protein
MLKISKIVITIILITVMVGSSVSEAIQKKSNGETVGYSRSAWLECQTKSLTTGRAERLWIPGFRHYGFSSKYA